MKWLQGTWTRRFNGLRGLIGRPFQDRYKSHIVEPGPLLARVCHSIHLNPVRAEAVTIEGILNHPFSSLPKFSAKKGPDWLVSNVVLSSAGERLDNKDDGVATEIT